MEAVRAVRDALGTRDARAVAAIQRGEPSQDAACPSALPAPGTLAHTHSGSRPHAKPAKIRLACILSPALAPTQDSRARRRVPPRAPLATGMECRGAFARGTRGTTLCKWPALTSNRRGLRCGASAASALRARAARGRSCGRVHAEHARARACMHVYLNAAPEDVLGAGAWKGRGCVCGSAVSGRFPPPRQWRASARARCIPARPDRMFARAHSSPLARRAPARALAPCPSARP